MVCPHCNRNIQVALQSMRAFVIQSHDTLPDGVRVMTLPLSNGFASYEALPSVLSYEGKRYGKTGWNSDNNIGYYRDDAKIAME